MSERVHVVAGFKVRRGAIDEFRKLAEALLVLPTQAEPGCISYVLCQDMADPECFAMIECWESEAALEQHLAQPALSSALDELRPFVAAAPVVQRLRAVSPR